MVDGTGRRCRSIVVMHSEALGRLDARAISVAIDRIEDHDIFDPRCPSLIFFSVNSRRSLFHFEDTAPSMVLTDFVPFCEARSQYSLPSHIVHIHTVVSSPSYSFTHATFPSLPTLA